MKFSFKYLNFTPFPATPFSGHEGRHEAHFAALQVGNARVVV
jgi:hypothetical protein